MDNEQNRSSSNYDVNSNRVRKSLFVLNSGKSNLNVNAVSFPSATRLPSCHSRSCFKAGLPSGLVIQCNPRIWRNISCRNFDSHDDLSRQPSTHHRRHSECNIAHRAHRPVVLPNGIFQLTLRDGIKIDITLDKAVRLTNVFRGIDVSIDAKGTSSSITHPNGKVNQYGSEVEVVCYDGTNRNDFVRYAKFWEKGISFTSSASALVYRIDSGGVRSTGDTITDLQTEHTVFIFLCGSRHGRKYFTEAMRLVSQSTHTRYDDGTDEIVINGIRITQKPYGVVKIHRLDNNVVISTNTENCSYTLTTPEIHSTAAMKDTPHLFVRRSTQRVHFNGSCFLVRFDGNSAGFDDTNRLKVY
ncbi:uncharacterized protein LOC119068130 isoform X1 [Bradysia coprophila]|uniref:uncharacterized protein LOC119068130 isoform X1 n=1 Tax=Bradysia coprophila TaxID=38358 RepID=UPI00187D8AAA|nr:uncharacterized protein LOC119068130 isoform X1 [Bradysia coprophila]